MKKLHVILFDLDDTLYPEYDFVLSGFRAVAKWGFEKFGIPEETSYQRLKEMFDDRIRGNTFNRWLEELGIRDSQSIDLAVQNYREHVPSIKLYPEVSDLLKRFQKRYLLGLITDGDWRIQERKISALGISDFFSVKVLTDKLGKDYWKPSPKPFQYALEQLDVAPEDTCYVGDNVIKDFIGARKAGMKTIWVRKDDGIYRSILPSTNEHSADHEINSISNLEQLLAKL